MFYLPKEDYRLPRIWNLILRPWRCEMESARARNVSSSKYGGGAKYKPPNTIILMMGTRGPPKKVPLLLGDPQNWFDHGLTGRHQIKDSMSRSLGFRGGVEGRWGW